MEGSSGSESDEGNERPKRKIVMNAGLAELMQKVDKLHKGIKEIEELGKKNKEQDEQISNIYEKFEMLNEITKNLTHRMDKKLKAYDMRESGKNYIEIAAELWPDEFRQADTRSWKIRRRERELAGTDKDSRTSNRRTTIDALAARARRQYKAAEFRIETIC